MRSEEGMDPTYRFELAARGTLLVYGEGMVSVIGHDGLVATIMTKPSHLVVKLEQAGQQLWQHSFTYSAPGIEAVPNGQAPQQKRGRGRPRRSPVPPVPRTVGDWIAGDTVATT